MQNLNASLVELINNQPITTSLKIAEVFEKRHCDILRDIKTLDCSREFNLRNFAEVERTLENGATYKMYNITRDGFTFLAMGFTGPKAAQFKEAYINAFNRMEQKLKSQLSGGYGYLELVDRPPSLNNLEIVKLDPDYGDGRRPCRWCPTVCDYSSLSERAQANRKNDCCVHTIFEKMLKSEIDRDYGQRYLLEEVLEDLARTNRKKDWDSGFNGDFIRRICELAYIGYKTKYGYDDVSNRPQETLRRLCFI
jgi:Rha family phage regulatory protein